MNPASLIPDWSGKVPADAVIRVTSNGDRSFLSFLSPKDNALGTVAFDSADVAAVFGHRTYPVSVAEDEAKVIVTLQKSSPPSRPFGPGTMTWTPSPDATDIAGNTCLTVDGVCKGTPVRESGHGRGPDVDF